MTSASLQTGQRQQHTVTPRLQHAVRLLQLSSLDFAQEVHDAMGKNPFLEVEDSPDDPAQAADGAATAAEGTAVPVESGDGADGSEMDAPYERENWQQGTPGTRNSNNNGE